MTCSVISENINIVVDNTAEIDRAPLTGSALQNSDINRAQLGTLLRRQVRSSASSTRRVFWSSFMSCYITQHANSND
jgi:hypothetical protein